MKKQTITVVKPDAAMVCSGLNKIQMDLLSSFLVGHWKEISESEHRVAFECILETLNPGALKAVKRLVRGDSNEDH